jgi:predicted AlkP superfamily pyrophosphatase or phosphodiesterase
MLRVILLIVLLVFPVTASAQNLFIMGWDGAGYNNIKPLLENGELPNLDRFLSGGGKLIEVETHTETATVAGWTTIFTGLTYDITAVLGNKPYNGEVLTPDDRLNFWLKNLPYYYSFINQLQNQPDAPLKVGWFVSKGFLSDDPTITPLNEITSNADSYVLSSPNPYYDYLDVLTRATIAFIESHENQDYVVFMHANPDVYGHKFGEDSPEYLNEFVRSDEAFGQILPYLSNDTIIIITTDHGFDEGGFSHMNAPDCWMATNLKIHPHYRNERKGANMRDIPVTILNQYELSVNPFLRGKSLLQ